MSDFKKYKIVSIRPPDANEWILISAVIGSQRYYIHQIYLANTSKIPIKYRMFITKGHRGSFQNAISFNTDLAGNTLLVIDMGIYLNEGENLIVQAAGINTICFTVFGALSTSKGEFEGEYD